MIFELGGDFDLANAGTEDSEDVVEETAADEGVLADDAEFVFVLDEAERFDERGSERGEEVAAKFRRKLRAQMREFGDGGVSGIKAGGSGDGLSGEPLDRRDGWWARDDSYLCALDLLGGLCSVAAIGEEASASFRNCKRGAGAGEADEVANVNDMGNEDAGESGFCKTTA